jgi:hypothetical protein
LMGKPSLPEKTNYPSLLLIFQEHTHIRWAQSHQATDIDISQPTILSINKVNFFIQNVIFLTLSFHNAPGRLSSQQVNTILTAIWKPNLTPRNCMKLLTSTAMAPDKLPPLILWHPFLTPS